MQKLIVIPSLSPDEKLINLITELIEHQVSPSSIIIVNDGSSEAYSMLFQSAANIGCTLLTHEVNLGKGQALKTAFKYILEHFDESVATVCADADGQHAVMDILACVNATKPNSLVIGCRRFDDKSIPLRSRMGNKVTRTVFKLLCGVAVSDTQTGLRAMETDVMRKLIEVNGSRFEYEMNMLIETKEQDIDIIQLPISTIYIEENKTSHFNPLKDSLRIYKVFAKFILSSLLGFIVDILVFTIIFELLQGTEGTKNATIIGSIVARIISSLVNYTVNKKSVFKFDKSAPLDQKRASMVKYFALCAVQLTCSTILVNALAFVKFFYEPVVKVFVDSFLFIISFQIQREWVFKVKKNKDGL